MSEDDFKNLHSSYQQSLTDFLRVDLDLAFTFLRAAKARTRSDPSDTLTHVRRVLTTVNELLGRVQDPTDCKDIRERSDELGTALKAFDASF